MIASDLAVVRSFLEDAISDQIHLVAILPDGPTAGRDFGTDIEAALAWATSANGSGKNVYWTVNSVSQGVNKKPAKADITQARFAHVDIDPPKDGSAWDRDKALAYLQALTAQPSFIVDSGNGLQAFWRLDGQEYAQEQVEAVNIALRDHFGADSCQNIDRLMRVPGFVNYPNKKKREAGRKPTLASWVQEDSGEAFTLDQITAALPAATPIEQAASNDPQLPAGLHTLAMNPTGLDRSANAFAFACAALREGWKDAEIVNVLLDARYPVSAHCLDQNDPQRATRRAVESARKAVREESATEAAQDVVEPWPEPVDLWASPEAPRLPEGLLPSVIRDFARAKAESMGCDPAGIAMAALATCAGAISDEIKLQPKRNESWTECARIWVGLVGNPSTRKSPILKAASKPLREREKELAAEHTQKLSRWLKLSKDEQKAAPEPIRERRLVEDATIEALQTVLKDTSRGIMSVQDEMSGWFGRLEKYSNGGGSAADRAFWLQAYNGGGYSVDRVGRGSFHIANNSISLAGGIQPEPLRNLANGSHDDGLIQRILPVILAPATLGSETSSEGAEQRYSELFERLELLKPPHEAGTIAYARAPKVTLSSAAQAVRWELEAEHMELVRAFEGMSIKLATALGKHDGLFCRLCLIWHCVETEQGSTVGFEIGKDTAERVAAFLRQFIRPHLFSFHIGVLGMSGVQDELQKMAAWIVAKGIKTAAAREVLEAGQAFRGYNADEVRVLFEKMEAFGWGSVTVPSGRAYKPRFEVNPRVFELFAQRGEAERERRETAQKLMAEAFKSRREGG